MRPWRLHNFFFKSYLFIYLLKLFIFNWRITALQYCVGFCHASAWISHRDTYVPSLLTLLPTYPTPLGGHGALGLSFLPYSKSPLAICLTCGNVVLIKRRVHILDGRRHSRGHFDTSFTKQGTQYFLWLYTDFEEGMLLLEVYFPTERHKIHGPFFPL